MLKKNAIVKLRDLRLGVPVDLDLDDEKIEWMKEVLRDFSDKFDAPKTEKTFAKFEGEIRKGSNTEIREYFILEGFLEILYNTNCVNTLEPMQDSLELEVNACFIEAALEEKDQYKDSLEIYVENESYDLYFYEKQELSLKEFFCFLIDMNKNDYPKLKPYVSDNL